MDSFFSLFEPAPEEGAPAARRRGRGAAARGAHAPDESSFLCEPDLSTDMLVKDVGYIDSYMEAGAAAPPLEQKKKRLAGRKSRRKKKPSPPKEFVPRQSWTEENLFYPERYNNEKVAGWNNKRDNWRQRTADNLGKNVNDLQLETSVESDWDYARKCKRRAEPFNLERQADGDAAACALPPPPPAPPAEPLYPMAREQRARACVEEEVMVGELDADVFYSSDEGEGGDVGSSSDMEEDSDGESYGSLPPEPQLGNVEYKLQLVGPSEKRFQHLVTQLKWRLRSGGGSAVYVLGVRDCGALRGLRARSLRASLQTLRRMAAALRATVRRVAARRVAPHRSVAEVSIRKLADTQQSVELRVAVMGANEAGKSTLIGVLTQGELDNGRGSARLNMFRHLHEVRSGRTSSLSHEILGFDAQGDVVNYGCSELMTAERIGERSAKLVSFLDLAGHSKYQRTTVHGLTGYSPHYAMLVVSATAGIGRMTEEHLALLLALDLPFVMVVTRLELAPGRLPALLARAHEILRAAGCHKTPLLIRDERQARACAAPERSPLLQRLDPGAAGDADRAEEVVPVFPVSCVSGQGLNALHSYLLAAEPPADPLSHLQPDPEEEACEFQIDEIFRAGDSGGPVVGGLLARGVLQEGDHLLIGPLDSGDFVPISVNTIYRNRVPCGAVRAGQSASLGLSRRPPGLRQGMVLLAVPPGYGGIKPSNLETSGEGRADCCKRAAEVTKDDRNKMADDVSNVNAETRSNCCKCTAEATVAAIKDDRNKMADEISNGNTVTDDTEDKIENCACNKHTLENGKKLNTDANTDEVSNGKLMEVLNLNSAKSKKDKKCNHMVASERDTAHSCCDANRNVAPETPATSQTGGEPKRTNGTSSESEGERSRTCVERRKAQRAERWDVKNFKRKENNLLRDLARAESDLVKVTGDVNGNLYRSDSDSEPSATVAAAVEGAAADDSDASGDEILLEDPDDPRGSLYFQATVRVLRHSTAIYPGFQATVHIGNIRQTAVIEGIMSWSGVLRAGGSASVVFRFVRQPEYVRAGRKLLFRAGLETRGVGRLTQVFPCARRKPRAA